MLFENDRHEALTHTAWNADPARQTIQAIIDDVEAARMPPGHWPVHPLDADDVEPATGYQSMYVGSAGVIWALWYLQKEKLAKTQLDLPTAIEQAAKNYQAAPDTGEVVPSYFLGEVGNELVRWRITGSGDAADKLHASIQKNIPNPTNEALWAAPGTMVAAWFLWEQTGDARWRDLFADNIEQLWRTWLPVPDKDFYLWTQDLYGNIVQLLGAGHGFVGNVYPLLRGASLLDAQRREELYARTVKTLRMTGVFEDGKVNWPQGIGTPRPGRTNMLMQWCHGAPGVITALADFPVKHSPELDELLRAGGEAVWLAGPLSKGFGVCHGTAGNGYAFLTLYQRTGNALWLVRARAFAMHAIEQYNSMREKYGHGRFSLWTGDLGLAVYLRHCIVGSSGLPLLDIVD